MRMFCGFIWVGLDVYALLSGLWVYKSFLFSCDVVRAMTSPSDAACGRASLGCGALFLLRGTRPACKKQTAAPAPLRLFLPQAAPQLRSPARVRAYKEWIRMLLLYLTLLTITRLEPKASKSLHYSLPRVRGRCRTQ